jgi:hypothetical protein
MYKICLNISLLGFISSLFVKHHSVRSHKRFFEDTQKDADANGEPSDGQKDVSIEITKEEHDNEVSSTVVYKSEIQKSSSESDQDVKNIVVEEESKNNTNA